MSKRRCQCLIYREILKVLKKGQEKPTRLMYAVGLSWGPLVGHIDSLVEKGCVERVNMSVRKRVRQKHELRITAKGRKALEHMVCLEGILEQEI